MTTHEAYSYLLEHRKSILCSSKARVMRKAGLHNSSILSIYMREYFDIPVVTSYLELRYFLTGDRGLCDICKSPTKLKNSNSLIKNQKRISTFLT